MIARAAQVLLNASSQRLDRLVTTGSGRDVRLTTAR
jgi:hypothetical protein